MTLKDEKFEEWKNDTWRKVPVQFFNNATFEEYYKSGMGAGNARYMPMIEKLIYTLESSLIWQTVCKEALSNPKHIRDAASDQHKELTQTLAETRKAVGIKEDSGE